MATAPLLSIGMIFKNEERCLERCLESLRPLRDAVPCELVMADTGAEDGSREIAARYADEVFDFEWIDDFAAARNAVMDHCHGKWYMTIDCDEWLDEDISELVAFLRKKNGLDYAYVTVRNYFSTEMEQGEVYNSFHALRLARRSTGARYAGIIHESLAYHEPAARLTRTIFHHDGYLFTDPKAAKKKFDRNMKLLRQTLEKTPDDLRTLNQCIESCNENAERLGYIRKAVELLQARAGQWQMLGGLILSHAVDSAHTQKLPELEEWIGLAFALCPDSVYVQVDVNYSAFLAAHAAKDWEKAIGYGEGYRAGLRALRAEIPTPRIAMDLCLGCLHAEDAFSQHNLLTGLANAYLQTGQGRTALQILAGIDGARLYPGQVRNTVLALSRVQAQTMLDAAPAMASFYRQLDREEPDPKMKAARLSSFEGTARAIFDRKNRQKQQELPGYWRPARTVFLALADTCEAGRAAALMDEIDPEAIRGWLARVEDWQALPIEALEYALREGVTFPLPEKPLSIEALDGLAARLTKDDNMARQLALALADDQEYPSLQSLFWAQSLVLAALRSFDWSLGKKEEKPASKFVRTEKKPKPDEPQRDPDTPETGLALIRRFVRVEAALLPVQYAPQMLTEENAALLPQLHRWGLYCVLAFEALDAGKPQEYLAALRRGLKACPGQKDMVQFLLDRFQEDTRPKASPELLALAEKVQIILAAYDPADPAVAAIRESPAYKQVAWLIEENPGLPVQ